VEEGDETIVNLQFVPSKASISAASIPTFKTQSPNDLPNLVNIDHEQASTIGAF
jgi:hypothetical protein